MTSASEASVPAAPALERRHRECSRHIGVGRAITLVAQAAQLGLELAARELAVGDGADDLAASRLWWNATSSE